ncbi:MAG: Nif3-like dinuclear metal center hexameric protein [Bacteroidales bacterium]|nr:Nif3-like dinuclear metal center hexameric protein [Bacteroidales bacterium]
MKTKEIFAAIEEVAPLRFQESYDNAGIQVGDADAEVRGVLLCTDVTNAVLDEAIATCSNLVISHHPLIFHGLKKIAGRTAVERMVAKAIRHGITVYSAHTNMDNTPSDGVSFKMAEKLGLAQVELLDAHSDGEQAYGSGVVGGIAPVRAGKLLERVKALFGVQAVRYSGDADTVVTRVALCGGAGAFLIDKAIEAKAHIFLTGDMKYHDFQGHEHEIVLADMGHYESEQFTKEIFFDIIQKKNPTFAVAFAKQERNPINYI